MLKKKITYTDYNGEERTEEFYFNLSKAELTEMELSADGGLETKINRIINSRDTKELISIFKDIILSSYGEKSDDGRRFIKSEEKKKAFAETEAYSNLFMELAFDADKASEFINGIIPTDMNDKIESLTNKK